MRFAQKLPDGSECPTDCFALEIVLEWHRTAGIEVGSSTKAESQIITLKIQPLHFLHRMITSSCYSAIPRFARDDRRIQRFCLFNSDTT